MEKVFVSGVGIVSPIGIDLNTFYTNLLEANRNVAFEKSAYFGHGEDCLSSRVSNIYKQKIDEIIGERASHLPQATKYAIYATKMALIDAGLTEEYLKGKKVSVIIGNKQAECEVFDKYIENGVLEDEYYSSSKIAKNICDYFGFTGIAYCVHNTCSSNNMAIDQALNVLRNLESDIVISGAADAFSLKVYTGFNSLKAISKTGCRPFSKERNGIVISEGAGIFILELDKMLQKRNKKPYCEVLSVGTSNDAYHLTKPEIGGITLAIERAIKFADIDKNKIDYIMAHGTGTVTNDRTEGMAINEVFKDCKKPQVCAIKGTVGHSMATAGAMGLVAICLIYKKRIIPPSPYSIPLDTECNVDVVIEKKRDDDFKVWMSNSFGFGGNNAVLLLKGV